MLEVPQQKRYRIEVSQQRTPKDVSLGFDFETQTELSENEAKNMISLNHQNIKEGKIEYRMLIYLYRKNFLSQDKSNQKIQFSKIINSIDIENIQKRDRLEQLIKNKDTMHQTISNNIQ